MRTPTDLESLAGLSDQQLLDEVAARAKAERRAISALVAALAELDARRLYLAQGYSSLFVYCTQVLHLSEHAAYNRIEAARAARRFPQLLERLADGSLTLTAIRLLAPHLTEDNHERLLDAAAHRSRNEVEQQVAALHPATDAPEIVRKLTDVWAPTWACSATIDSHPDVVRPLAPERYLVQFTIAEDALERLRRVQDLVRHSIPSGSIGEVFDRALALMLDDLERRKLARTDPPRPCAPAETSTRYVPAAVRRAVWRRDGGQCTFIGGDGRCQERRFLEVHHLTPFAEGGLTSVENLALRCRSHNRYESGRQFGSWVLREHRPAYVVTRLEDVH